MLKYLLIFFTTSIIALPVGNPWETCLYEQAGLVNCDFCFEKFCWNRFTFRVGYQGDYVFNRYLQVNEGVFRKPNLDHTKITTNAAFVAANFCNRLDIFASLGASKFLISTPASAFDLRFTGAESVELGTIAVSNFTSFDPNGIMEMTTESALSWSAGLRGILWKCGSCVLGAEAQYFRSRPNIKRVDLPPISQNLGGSVLVTFEEITFTRQAPSTIYPSSSPFNYDEWQVALSIAHAIGISPTIHAVPYLAANFGQVHVGMDHLDITTTPPGAPTGLAVNVVEGPEAFKATLNNLKQQQSVGFVVGLGIVGCNRFSADVEWRFVNESAFYTNFQISF